MPFFAPVVEGIIDCVEEGAFAVSDAVTVAGAVVVVGSAVVGHAQVMVLVEGALCEAGVGAVSVAPGPAACWSRPVSGLAPGPVDVNAVAGCRCYYPCW